MAQAPNTQNNNQLTHLEPQIIDDPLAHITQPNLACIIKSRKETLYEGKATAVASNNDAGRFDVLPQHANFISMIKDYIVVYKEASEPLTIEITRGVMRVYENNLHIYLTVS